MTKFNFDKTVNRLGKNSYKYHDNDKNALPMWIADMDFPAFPKIKESIITDANVDAYGYTFVPDSYFHAYKNYWKRHHDADFELDDAIYSTGIIAALDVIFRNFIPKGSGVIIQTPIYPTFISCINNTGLKIVENKLIYEDDKVKIDFKDLEEKIKDKKNKVFLLCNPHNPTGYIFSKDEINYFAKLCYENDVLLVSDEIHSEIVSPGYVCNSTISVNSKYQSNIITMLSCSKCFNIAGLHSSCIVCKEKELKDKLQSFIYHDDVGEPNYFAVNANIAALNYGDEWLLELNEYIHASKQLVIKKLADHGIKAYKSYSTYLLWIDISKYSNDSDEFTKLLKQETGLELSSGKNFLGDGYKFVRMNVATSRKNVIDGVNRLISFIEKNS